MAKALNRSPVYLAGLQKRFALPVVKRTRSAAFTALHRPNCDRRPIFPGALEHRTLKRHKCRAPIPDPSHSQVEDRSIVLGQSHQRKLLVVVHAERGDNIRIVSARRASRRERKSYEESN